MKNIYLTGFMGAGKSTTGRELAGLLGYKFVDLDQEVVKKENKSIKEIFAVAGEAYFRRCESEMLQQVSLSDATVFATGGGIVENELNRSFMRGNGLVVYLDAQWSTLQDRLKTSQDRPLANSGQNWDDVKQRWQTRQKYYRDADYIVETDGLNPGQVAKLIKKRLESEDLS